ncbi:MAG TPA: radical SAM protein [Candidatus Nanoarchaeia archaeon]|nr:radical SAM protein [Candidatus Nanoarchaeia archaeon]
MQIQLEKPQTQNKLIRIDRSINIPLIGAIHIGVIDRGSNLLQVRASTYCNMKCTFCSTAANSQEIHPYNYEIELDYLLEWIKEAIKLKNNQVNQINIDSVGEPTAYPKIAELIREVKKIKGIEFVTMQSNGTLLNQEKIKMLESAGLGRINLSIHSLDQDFSKKLFGSQYYNIEAVKAICKLINNSKIELNITPVYIPNVNDNEIPHLINLAKELNCRISIQKYELYRYSRKEKKAKMINWYKFYRKLDEWENEFNYKLKLGPLDFNMKKSQRIPLFINRGDVIRVKVVMHGWMPNEMISVYNNRLVTIVDCASPINSFVSAKVLETRDSIYIAKKL